MRVCSPVLFAISWQAGMTLLQVSALTADRVIALSLGHRAAFHWTGALTITNFHNPACSTSRKVLDMIRASGEELRIVEYLKHLPSRDELTTMHFSPSDLSGARCV
jgi:uncharacterized membrane protein YfbV (UPF0208 family)